MSGQYPPPGNAQRPPGVPNTGYPTAPPTGPNYPQGQYPGPPPPRGYYPPPPAGYGPGSYAPPTGAVGGYPPGGFPMAQYPGAPVPPGQYPGVGAPGPYPGAPVPPGSYPGAGVTYPPGPYPQPGYYPPPGSQAVGQYPVVQTKQNSESEDSDPHEFGLRSREDKNPMSVKFVNRSGKKLNLYWIDKKGRHKKIKKLKEGKSTDINTYETHAFMAVKKHGDPVTIDGNVTYFARPTGYGNQVQVEVRKCPDTLMSPTGNHLRQVAVKFVNRTKRKVYIQWINGQGHEEEKKTLGPGRCWRTFSFEGNYWLASDKHDNLLLNYGGFYKVPPLSTAHVPGYKERVIITEDIWNSSSSSSSGSSSSDY